MVGKTQISAALIRSVLRRDSAGEGANFRQVLRFAPVQEKPKK
jgi:hypothetical protein